MAIIKKELWFDTNGDGTGYETVQDAVEKRLAFIMDRSRKETNARALVNNYKEVIRLLSLIDTEKKTLW